MKPPPEGWPRMAAAVFYEDALAGIDFLRDAFGFAVGLVVEGEGGRVEHSQLTYHGALVMVATSGARDGRRDTVDRCSPAALGGKITQSLMLYIDDVDAHCESARAAGATIVHEPTTVDYGDDYWSDRTYGATDPEGHLWWFCQRLRDPVR